MTNPFSLKEKITTIILIAAIILATTAAVYAILNKETRPQQTEEINLPDVKASLVLRPNINIKFDFDSNYYTYATITFEDSAAYDIEYGYPENQIDFTHHNLESVISPSRNGLRLTLDNDIGDHYIKIINLERGTNQTVYYTIDAGYNLEVEP